MVPLALAAIVVIVIVVIVVAAAAVAGNPASGLVALSAGALLVPGPKRGVSGDRPVSASASAFASGGGTETQAAAPARARFYSENAVAVPPVGTLPAAPLVLFYNVHCFISLRDEDGDMKIPVERFLSRLSPYTEYVALAEVSGHRSEIENLLHRAGYPFVTFAANGAPDRSSFLVLASKVPVTATVVDTATGDPGYSRGSGVHRVDREQIVFTTASGLRGCAVHLEIGQRYSPGNAEVNVSRKGKNSSLRIRQLSRVLEHSPDFLIGDFNFTLDDPEREFLRGRGFEATHRDEIRSTPFNRVDHFFVRRGLVEEGNMLIRCNYSDHLPMVQTLPAGPTPGGAL